jgi:iron(III) transport system ATP-binding protein
MESFNHHSSLDVKINNLKVQFDDFVALNNINVNIKAGEFFTLLGPSGCGKTTLLRSIAGFNKISNGNILIGGKNINILQPWERNLGFVFQNYALWPTMTVFENISYGLKVRKLPKDKIISKVLDIMRLVKLEDYANAYPNTLSGGMQQRTALARALVIDPPILLLDEPLSNLDAKLRILLRNEIRQIQQRLSITALYVTHDQEEALDISDTIAVMNEGEIIQVGYPRQIYKDPNSSFVADFLGKANFIKGKALSKNEFKISDNITIKTNFKNDIDINKINYCFIRPEDVKICNKDQSIISATIIKISFLGNLYRYLVKIFDEQFITIETNESHKINESIYINFLPTIGFEKIEISNNNEINNENIL